MNITLNNNASITLNMIEYAGIYLKTQNPECARILTVSVHDAVHSIRSLHKLLSSYWGRGVFRTLLNIWDGAFCKKNNAWVKVHNQKFFRGRFAEKGHFDKDFVKSTRKCSPAGKHFGVFLPRYFKNYMLTGKSNPKMNTIRAFLSKIRTIFSIFKKGWGGLRSPA